MTTLITVTLFVLGGYYVGSVFSRMTILGATFPVALGFKKGVSVSRSGLIYYHKRGNLIGYPKLASQFKDLHKAPISYKDCLNMLTEEDRARHNEHWGFVDKFVY